MTDREPFGTESVLSKDVILEKVGHLAYFLTKTVGIKRVGIAGSLARGKENPSDVDFIIFLPPLKALDDSLDTFAGNRTNWSEHLGLNREQKNSLKIFFDDFMINGIRLDVHFLPDTFDKACLKSMVGLSGDPDFLLQIIKDILIFDPKSEKFTKQSVFSEEQIGQIRQFTFERMKSLVNDDRILDQIFVSPGSQKRRRSSSKQKLPNR